MALKLLMRGGIYLLFIAGVAIQWLYTRNGKKKNSEQQATVDQEVVAADPIKQHSHPDWRIRLSAIQHLAENPDPQHISTLIMRLYDDVYDVRESAASALIAHGDDAVINTIEVLDNGSLEAREMAIQVLAGLPTELSIAALERALLEDESAWVRIPAAQALGKLADKSTVTTLIRALEDNHRDVYDAVVVALNQIGSLEGIQAIADHPYREE